MSKRWKKLGPDVRSAQILAAAVKLAKRDGYLNVTREGIAEAAEVSAGLVSKYLGTMPEIRERIMREAVANEVLPIIAAGVSTRHRIAMRAPLALRQRALASLAA